MRSSVSAVAWIILLQASRSDSTSNFFFFCGQFGYSVPQLVFISAKASGGCWSSQTRSAAAEESKCASLRCRGIRPATSICSNYLCRGALPGIRLPSPCKADDRGPRCTRQNRNDFPENRVVLRPPRSLPFSGLTPIMVRRVALEIEHQTDGPVVII